MTQHPGRPFASIRMGRRDEGIGAGREDREGPRKEGVFPNQGEYLAVDERGLASGPVATSGLDVIGKGGWDGDSIDLG